jgi:uncharacterized DUF497 family protein
MIIPLALWKAASDLSGTPTNTNHLKRHRVSPAEFEELIARDPVFLEYAVENGEERFKVLGATKRGRVLIAVWTPRDGSVRAITAYDAGRRYERLYWEICG